MENETKNKISPFSIFVTGLFVVLSIIYVSKSKPVETGTLWHPAIRRENESRDMLAISWADLGSKMVAYGVIDKNKIENLYSERGGLSESDKKIIYGTGEDSIIIIDSQNAGLMLNMLWGFGLANKNAILENGPMVEAQGKDGTGKFASTGGWSLSTGNPMDHYSMHSFVTLTKEQQLLVEKVSKGIFRPCCNNSTYFPDCNHGMAMLGFLEIMASQGASEKDMYKSALQLNKLWFPDQYDVIASYLESRGQDINNVDPKEIVSEQYFSAQGYKNIVALVQPIEQKGGGGCSV